MKRKIHKRYGKYVGMVRDSELRITASSVCAFSLSNETLTEFPTEDEAVEYIREQGDTQHEQ